MKHTLKLSILASASLLLLSACDEPIPSNAYDSRGTPESLLNISQQRSVIALDNAKGLDDLIAAIERDKPVQASLECSVNDKLCQNARKTLMQYHVPGTEKKSMGGNQVVLTYERVSAKDCDPRYIDNSSNYNNLNHASFGCANAANMVQQVSDKRQFVDPALLGYGDGSKAAQTYKDYMTPKEAGGETESLLQSSGGGGN